LIFITSTLISLYIAEQFLPEKNHPQKTKIKRLYYPRNYQNTFKNIEFEYRISTNEQGIRYHNIPLQKDDDIRRIFIVGDSFTEGTGVKNDQTYSHLLENDFGKTDNPIYFINGGYRGTGPMHYYFMFDQVGRQYNPDALIIALFANDLASIPEDASKILGIIRDESKFSLIKLFEETFPNITAYIKQSKIKPGNRKNKHTLMSFTIEAKEKGIPKAKIIDWRNSIPQDLAQASRQMKVNPYIFRSGLLYPEIYLDSIDVSSKRGLKKWENLTEILSEIINNANDHKLEVAIVYIPSCYQYDPDCLSDQNPKVLTGTQVRKEWLTDTTNIQKLLSSWTKSKDVPFLDLTPHMKREITSGNKLNYPIDGHWNKEGHKAAAKAIREWLNSGDVFSFINLDESYKQ